MELTLILQASPVAAKLQEAGIKGRGFAQWCDQGEALKFLSFLVKATCACQHKPYNWDKVPVALAPSPYNRNGIQERRSTSGSLKNQSVTPAPSSNIPQNSKKIASKKHSGFHGFETSSNAIAPASTA